MKLLKIWLITTFAFSLMFVSCVQSEYNWDNLNTEGVLKIPPIPLGSYEMTFFDELEPIEFEIPGGYVVQYEDTLKNIFSASTIKDFFRENMERNVSIDGDIEMSILGENNDFRIELNYNVLYENYNIIEEIVMEGEEVKNNETQPISIVLPKEMAEYKEDSRHLLIKIKIISSSGKVEIDSEESYIQLKDLIIKTSGYFFDL